MATSIPGFYFDTAKGKYFKILPNHIAPGGSKYSQQSVSKEKHDTKVGQFSPSVSPVSLLRFAPSSFVPQIDESR